MRRHADRLAHGQLEAVVGQIDRELLPRLGGARARQIMPGENLISGRLVATIADREPVRTDAHAARQIDFANDIELIGCDRHVLGRLIVDGDLDLARAGRTQRRAGAGKQGLERQHRGLRRGPNAAGIFLCDQPGERRAGSLGVAARFDERQGCQGRRFDVAALATAVEWRSAAGSWVDFKDFGFYLLEPLDIYYVGGFGVMGWVTAEDYQSARVDPLANAAPRILEHMNSDHVPAMILLAKVHAGLDATEATMTAVDRLGFHLRLKTADGMKGTRINFLCEVQNSDEARKVLVEMVCAAEPKA